jgi:two-component system, cell cycle sensor histidine kinase and response regulator CckA
LVENANEVIVVAQDGMLKFVNRITSELFGYSEQELTSRPFPEFIHPDDRGMVVERHLRRLKGDVSQPRYAFRLVTRDGSIKWVEIGAVLIDWEGRPATLNFLNDITERKLAEEKNNWLASFPTLNPTPILEIDQKKGITFINTSAKKLFPDLENKQMDHPFVAGTIKYFTKLNSSTMLHDDREIEVNGHWYLQTFFLVSPNQLRIYALDITERKQMEREIIHSERMAIAGQLAAGVAHEFNNLLSIIGGSAEYAKGIRNEHEIKKSLEVIVKSANRGAQVVKKLLTFTKRIELKKESVDLIEVIEEVVGLVKRDLENNSITVVRNYSDIPKTLIDVGQIQQVFLNLIINAKNVMSKGGKLAIKVEKEGKFIKIQFHNTGEIINQEDLPKLFTPFFRTSMRQKEGMPGTGLGLAVSYGIIKAHNGEISAESVKGKGTTFTLLLSVTENENRAEVLPKAVAKAVKNNKRKLKQAEILIVDDEFEIGKLFKKVLDKEGYSVTVAGSGRNALNLCRKKKFDLIYLDIIMPGMDGISVFKKIKEISPKTKIVFFTGKLMEDKVAGMYLDEGAAGFLRKPIPLKDLVSYTQNILKAKNE